MGSTPWRVKAPAAINSMLAGSGMPSAAKKSVIPSKMLPWFSKPVNSQSLSSVTCSFVWRSFGQYQSLNTRPSSLRLNARCIEPLAQTSLVVAGGGQAQGRT